MTTPTTTPIQRVPALTPLWTDSDINEWFNDSVIDFPSAGEMAFIHGLRNEYEQDRQRLHDEAAAKDKRIAELEAQLISVSRELTSTSNADRYYRGFNDGFDFAELRISELEQALQEAAEEIRNWQQYRRCFSVARRISQ